MLNILQQENLHDQEVFYILQDLLPAHQCHKKRGWNIFNAWSESTLKQQNNPMPAYQIVYFTPSKFHFSAYLMTTHQCSMPTLSFFFLCPTLEEFTGKKPFNDRCTKNDPINHCRWKRLSRHFCLSPFLYLRSTIITVLFSMEPQFRHSTQV